MKLPEKGSRPFDALGLGEVMLRLTPPNKERLANSDSFEKTAGGSELNVMCGLSMLGLRTGILTKLPDNPLGQFIKNRIRYTGVSDDYLVWDHTPAARLGVYFYEMGVYPRKSAVTYDRKNSSINTLTVDKLPDAVFSSARIFHVSGITLGLGAGPAALAAETVRRFKAGGARISFDVNYRAALWGEGEARRAVEAMLPMVDILSVSEETSRRMLGRKGSAEDILRGYAEDYGCGQVAMTMRTASSPTRHTWAAKLYVAEADTVYEEPPYIDIEVVDRVGSGDAFVAGVLSGLLLGHPPQECLGVGNAMAAVKNTILGDMPSSTWGEIGSVMAAHAGEAQSEMVR